MKRRLWVLSAVGVLMSGLAGVADATLVTIGTAQFGGIGTEYNLIWDNDNNGNSVVWLDYSYHGSYRDIETCQNGTCYNTYPDQITYLNASSAPGLNSALTYNINTAYSVDWGANSWRLPNTVDGPLEGGYDGTTTAGFNIISSEIGHLFYEELGNIGFKNTDGSENSFPPPPNYFLQNTGDFENLHAMRYTSATVAAGNPSHVWIFDMQDGQQTLRDRHDDSNLVLPLRTGHVSANPGPAPVPEPTTMLLMGTGLIGIIGARRKKKAE